jgi:hypothetical protein
VTIYKKSGEHMKKKKKFNKYARRRLLLLIGIIAVILIIKTIIEVIFSGKEPKEITLLLDNKLIEVKHEIISENDTIYLSKDDIESLFDSTIYYNEAEKELITTYNKHIALLKIDEDFMVVNDSNAELKNPMIEKDKTVYLPFSEMGIVYDLEFEYSAENKRLIADSLSKEKKKAITLKNFKLKDNPRFFGSKIEKISQGEYLTIVEDTSKKYYKVRSSNGNIGYVKKKKLSNEEVVRDDWDEETEEFNILKDFSSTSKDYTKAKLDKNKQNVVIPTFLYLEKDGEILDKTASSTDEYKNYISWANENNVEVWATLSNDIEVSNSLLTYTSRNKVINELYKKMVEYQFSGINIDFKKIDDLNSFNRFIIELTPRLKELGIKVSVTNNENIDKDKLSKIVDIIVE